ncbi:hypothetical protein V3C99_007079 [Haemonchus contortus]
MNQLVVLLLLVSQLVALSLAQYGYGYDSYGDPQVGFDTGAAMGGIEGALMGAVDGIFLG